MLRHSNTYSEILMKKQPHLSFGKRKGFYYFSMYHFLTMIYYMGIVRLPDTKDDYWSSEKWMPEHPLCVEHGMTRNRFRFIWRHFHVNHDSATVGEVGEYQNSIDNETEDILKQTTSEECTIKKKE